MRGDAAMRLGILVLMAMFLAGCSNSTPVAPVSATESAEMVEKNCADPQWKDKNLGLWYSICRRPMNW
jgi:PBP1b-binding outer membrane lipoprotein LpoB